MIMTMIYKQHIVNLVGSFLGYQRNDLARQHLEIAGKAAALIKEAWRDDPNYSRKPLNKTRRKQ